MDQEIRAAIQDRVSRESYAKKMGLRLKELDEGRAVVEMEPQPDNMNIFGMTHGGAIFSLIDEAFQISCNSYGTVAVALSMSVTYHRTPESDNLLQAESKEIHRTRKTATYEISVKNEKNERIASCLALAYRKEDRLPFLGKIS